MLHSHRQTPPPTAQVPVNAVITCCCAANVKIFTVPPLSS